MEVLQLLLQHGADPLLQDHHGRDPHRVALRNNNSAVAELLGGAMKRLSDCRVAAGDMVSRASNEGYTNVHEGFTITEKAPTRTFSWLKAATTTFTFKTLLRHYAKQALTPR